MLSLLTLDKRYTLASPTMSNVETISRPASWIARLILNIIGIIEALLGFRFLLKFLGANPNAQFTSFLYDLTAPIVAPFLSVFRVTLVEGFVIEWATILAMVVYSFIASVILKFFVMSRPTYRVVKEGHDRRLISNVHNH